jgi:hypothetical protein
VVLLLLRQRRGAAGSGLCAAITYSRRTTSAAEGNGLGATIKYLRQTTSGAAGNGLGITIKHLYGAEGIGLGTMIKYLRGNASIGLGITIKYLRRTTRKRPGHHNQVPATHNERRRGQRPEPIMGITDVSIHHKRPAFVFFCACIRRQQAYYVDLEG